MIRVRRLTDVCAQDDSRARGDSNTVAAGVYDQRRFSFRLLDGGPIDLEDANDAAGSLLVVLFRELDCSSPRTSAFRKRGV